jgi:asparagine synthase (glutamine-hydrolysing)
MFLSLHLGSEEAAVRWRTVMAQHGKWLGLVPHFESRTTIAPDPVNLSAGWLLKEDRNHRGLFRDTPDRFLATSYDRAFLEDPIDGSINEALLRGEVRALRIVVCLRTGEVSVVIPPATPEQCLIRREGAETLLGNDFRVMVRWGGLQIDSRAMWALYEYGAIPAPLTLDRNTQRVPDGHRCDLDLRGSTVRPAAPVPSLERLEEEQPPDETAAIRRIDSALDTQLAEVPPGAVLYFSGGVDSGLLASRLARLGRRDVFLLNYLLGSEDGHSRAARQMATRLGMPFEQVRGDLSGAHVSLERAALDYSAPFSDPALATTNLLVHSSLARESRTTTVIDGTGADGGFGFGVKAIRAWRRAQRVPPPLRHLGGMMYHGVEAWRFESRLEKGLGELRTLSKTSFHHASVALGPLDQTSFHHASVALGPLDGILYHASTEDRRSVEGAVASLFQNHTPDRSLRDQLAYLDLVQTCAARFAAKTFDPLRRHGVTPVYPYLDPALIRAAFTVPWSEKCRNGELKSLLKRMLLRDLPRELVYLPKQGFAAPVLETVGEPRVRELVSEVVLGASNPAMDICSKRKVRALVARVEEGKQVSKPARRFLWSLVFTSIWLHGIRSELPGPD